MSYVFRVPDEIYTEVASYAAQRGQTPDALLIELVTEGVEQLKHREVAYDPTHDPLAPFIGAFDSGDDDTGWIERHDVYFAGNGDVGERDGNKE